MPSLNWRFDNSYARLPEAFFVKLAPTPVRAPKLVLFNQALARDLGIDGADMDAETLARIFSGNEIPEVADPLAQAYAGHQFGNFTMLGDGRAIVLGEQVTPDGLRFDIQLKGSGPTPFSRRGDGRAALGPMLREYIISEAMAALGIETTRSLAVVATGEPVLRDEIQRGAVLTRVAASHLRVGTFEYASARGDVGELAALVNYAIDRHYPDRKHAPVPALALLEAVIVKQAELIVDWMRVGFIHGVMNTDNMTISGETIDYGPCAFMDSYDPATVFSSIDTGRRYAFGNQPPIAQWNLSRLALALLPLFPEPALVEQAEQKLSGFKDIYEARWLAMMRGKLGLFGEEAGDEALANDLLIWMHDNAIDYTGGFRALVEGEVPAQGIFAGDPFRAWHDRWQQRLSRNPKPLKSSRCLMADASPIYIPRNHLVEQALEAAVQGDDLTVLNQLLDALRQPYTRRVGFDAYSLPDPAGSGHYRTFCGT